MDARVEDSPTSLTKFGIRGQLIQGYTTKVNTAEEVDKIEEDFVGSGTARIWFESGGSIMCIDATIKDFDPVLAHLHKGDFGKNGVQLADLSSKRRAAGHYLGCGSLSELGVNESQRATLAANFLANPEDYYIQFHQAKADKPEFHNAVRGQFEMPY